MITASLRGLARRLRERKLRAEALLDCARISARAADHLFAAGIYLGPLQGILVSVKDVYGLEGLPTFAGTRRALPPSFSDEGTLIRALKRQVPVITGKTHTPTNPR